MGKFQYKHHKDSFTPNYKTMKTKTQNTKINNLIEKAFLKATEQDQKKKINLKKKFPKWEFVKAKTK